MGGDPQPVTNTTTQQLAPEQRQLLNMAMPYLQQFGASNITAPGPESVAPFDPMQVAGQNQALASTMAMNDILTGAGQSNQYLTSGMALDPNTNPALRGTIDAAVRPIYQNLTETELPAIRGQAAVGAAGPSANYGGSRQGIAEGLAAGRASQAAGDAASKISYQGYQSGLDAMLKSMGLSPTIAQSQAIPAGVTSAVGDVRQNQAQRVLGAGTAADQFAQWLPYIKANAMLGGVGAIPGGSTTSTGTAPQSNLTNQIIGGGAAAGGLLAGAAQIAPYLGFVAASDMRLKRDIVQIGTLFDGTPIYRYRYAGNNGVHIGVLAQDIEKFAPEAVQDVEGYKFVNIDLATKRAMEARQ